jgi:arsenical pump membrane protein
MDRWLALGLLFIGVVGAMGFVRPLPAWTVPAAAAVLDIVVGVIAPGATGEAVRPLLAPVGFLLAAIPLAVMLDRLGFFSAMATRVTARGGGPGYLWALAAVVTTVLNLDAGVVLLTPLYVRIAHQRGWDPLSLAVQPVMLACLASSALPVSNLTNLIAASWTGAGVAQFVSHLALPSGVASAVGWWFYKRTVANALPGPKTPPGGRQGPQLLGGLPLSPEETRQATRTGGLVVLAVLVGFTCGSFVGIQPWVVALGADAVMAFVVTSGRDWRKRVPWRSVPLATAVMVFALGVLATGAAGYLPIGSLLQGTALTDLARDTGLATLGANVVNNLPALLVALPKIGHHPVPALWAVLLGVNMGPVVLVTGSLASLLWLSTLRRLGVEAGPLDFARFGSRVGLPAAASALVVALGLTAVGLR